MNFSADLASKVESDKLEKDDIYHVTKLIYDNELHWKSDEILNAWSKTRSKKNEKCSRESRESGNSFLKNGDWSKALVFYNQAVVLAEMDSQRSVSLPSSSI